LHAVVAVAFAAVLLTPAGAVAATADVAVTLSDAPDPLPEEGNARQFSSLSGNQTATATAKLTLRKRGRTRAARPSGLGSDPFLRVVEGLAGASLVVLRPLSGISAPPGPIQAVRQRTDEQLWHVLRYVALNPVEAGVCSVPQDYRGRAMD
jgi:hypothetical protein